MTEKTSIYTDIKNNLPAVFILMVGFMPGMLNDYAVYLLVLMLPLMWCYGFLKFTENSVMCLTFGVVFALAYKSHTDIPLSVFVMYLLFPFISYQSGQFIFKRFRSVDSFSILFIILAVCIGFYTIFLCIKDFFDTGQIVNVTRSIGIDEDVWEKDAEAIGIGATNMGVYVSLLLGIFGLVCVKADNSSERIVRTLAVFGAVLGFYVTIHLLNRTGLLLMMISVLIGFTRPPLSAAKIGVGLLVILVAASLLSIVVQSNEIVQKAIEGYAARNDVVGYGIASAGGRTDRWAAAFEQIPTIPLGAPQLDFPGIATYAHNLFLDTFIIGGWASGILMIIMMARFIMNSVAVLTKSRLNRFTKAFFLMIVVVMILQCMVEPILQSSFPYFCLLLFFWAFINDLSHSDIMKKEDE